MERSSTSTTRTLYRIKRDQPSRQPQVDQNRHNAQKDLDTAKRTPCQLVMPVVRALMRRHSHQDNDDRLELFAVGRVDRLFQQHEHILQDVYPGIEEVYPLRDFEI
jgi:hypothetical protein